MYFWPCTKVTTEFPLFVFRIANPNWSPWFRQHQNTEPQSHTLIITQKSPTQTSKQLQKPHHVCRKKTHHAPEGRSCFPTNAVETIRNYSHQCSPPMPTNTGAESHGRQVVIISYDGMCKATFSVCRQASREDEWGHAVPSHTEIAILSQTVSSKTIFFSFVNGPNESERSIYDYTQLHWWAPIRHQI